MSSADWNLFCTTDVVVDAPASKTGTKTSLIVGFPFNTNVNVVGLPATTADGRRNAAKGGGVGDGNVVSDIDRVIESVAKSNDFVGLMVTESVGNSVLEAESATVAEMVKRVRVGWIMVNDLVRISL